VTIENNFTLVTGSDSSHARSLLNFLASAKMHEPNIRVIIYDLGMKKFQLRRLAKKFDYEVRKFDYSKYPTYLNIKVNAGEYAWKPVTVQEVAEQMGGIVCWMDAGNIITEPLGDMIEETKTVGFWRTFSGGTIGRWTHPSLLDYFGLQTNWKSDVEMYAGGCVAFDTENKSASKLLVDWAKYAQIRECIAPEGSNRTNHRQDQALLSVLANIQDWPIPSHSKPLPVAFHQDVDGGARRYFRRMVKKTRLWFKAKFVKHKPHGNV
jgi:hypothetical protein